MTYKKEKWYDRTGKDNTHTQNNSNADLHTLHSQENAIEYPISVNKIENHRITTEGLGHKCGALCVIKPCDKKYHGKSYIGIYIGNLPINIITSFDEEQGILTNRTMDNPAIFVPELKKIIYGCESWWKEIESPDDFKEITIEDIENQWYMKILKSWK